MSSYVCISGRPLRRPWFPLWLSALLSAALIVGAAACAPDLPPPSSRGVAGPAEEDSGVQIELDPPAPIDEAPPILRVRLLFSGVESVDLERVFVVHGEVGPAHLRQIEKGMLSKALAERLVPSLAWLDEGDDPGDASLVVAPLSPLWLGETYAVALGIPSFAAHLQVASSDTSPRLDRIWPPDGSSATDRFGVWCGPEPLPPVQIETQLDPSGIVGFLRTGAVDGAGSRCLRFEGSSDQEGVYGARLVGPPAIDVAGAAVRLDPRPFTIDAQPQLIEPVLCGPDEVPFGPGCARIEDDRLFGRSPKAHLLWIVAGEGLDQVFTTVSGAPFVLKPLPPQASIMLDVSVVDTEGILLRNVVSSTTLAPMAHIVVNEVLANPLGPEPGQEWVELVNDGYVLADLSGYVLEDVGGATPLPEAELAPGDLAILVNEDFVEDGELDPAPDPLALILRVPKLGKAGLSNSGEPLKLKDSAGRVVSRFPVGPRVKAGWSVSRTGPTAPDGLASSFKPSLPSPGVRNGL